MEESEPIGLNCNNINIATVGNSGFPCDTLGIKRDSSKQDNIRRIEAERKAWNNNIDHMVKLKYISSLLRLYTYICSKCQKYVIG